MSLSRRLAAEFIETFWLVLVLNKIGERYIQTEGKTKKTVDFDSHQLTPISVSKY